MDYIKQVLINHKEELEITLEFLKKNKLKSESEIEMYSQRISEVEYGLAELEKMIEERQG